MFTQKYIDNMDVIRLSRRKELTEDDSPLLDIAQICIYVVVIGVSIIAIMKWF